MTEKPPPRWLHRFSNFSRAFGLLRELVDLSYERELTQVEKEATIQRFEYTWELAWKVLHDYLKGGGVILPEVMPRTVIRAAFAANVIQDGEDWMDALDARNLMSHVYDTKVFEKVIADIKARYFALFDDLYMRLLEERAALDG